MMTDKNLTPQEIFLQENCTEQVYGINQDDSPGMVRYFRADSDYIRIQKILAMAFMNLLDNERPEGMMCLSNKECADIEEAFILGDWDKLFQYAEKYIEKKEDKELLLQDLDAEIKKYTEDLYHETFGNQGALDEFDWEDISAVIDDTARYFYSRCPHPLEASEEQRWTNFLGTIKKKKCGSFWKPSEEQIGALENTIKCEFSAGLHVRAEILRTLYEQLKKL